MTARAIVIVALLAGTAHAEPWYRGKYGHNRVVHTSLTAIGGVVYFSSETFLKPYLGSVTCRWCTPDSLDASVRNALVWHDTALANELSDVTGYVAAPIVGFGLVLLGESHHDWAQVIDDTMPIFESVVVSELALEVVKFIALRERPFAYFGAGAHQPEDNLSFMSGHAELTFGIATSAGLIAHRNGYWTEPYIWVAGMTLAATTSYLRIAADKHYFTDVVGGSVVGVIAALTVPSLMERPAIVVPTGNGLAITGVW